MSPFMCAKFQLDQSMHSCLMADFVQNKGENKEIASEFWLLLSWDWLEWFSSNLVYVDSPGISAANLVYSNQKSRSCICAFLSSS